MENIFNEAERTSIEILKMQAKTHFDTAFNGSPAPFVKENVVLAGGAFVSWTWNQIPKDIDCFVLDNNLSQDILRDHLKNLKFKAKDAEYIKNTNAGAKNVQEVWEGKFTIKGVRDPVTYQFIFTSYKTRQDLLAQFDYKHCMVSYHKDTLYLSRTMYDAIKNKHLIVNNPDVVTQWRQEKYNYKGFFPPPNNHKTLTLGDILSAAFNKAA